MSRNLSTKKMNTLNLKMEATLLSFFNVLSRDNYLFYKLYPGLNQKINENDLLIFRRSFFVKIVGRNTLITLPEVHY
ncbi:hypothetical protein [uncultured Aquimarina sp.]|uniref:hypothetical protein n=1 Tax=uncultured Aquimarina sp. TaxID=575652 RepID=UPI00260D18B1|nr:hypothetical protein [uncultured Aquimarina sp.]